MTGDVLAALDDQPRDGPGPPRHQARQRHGDQARRREGHGLRHRPRHAVRRHVDDADRHGRRHPAVPLARTGPRPWRGRALRPVLGRHHAVPAADRPDPVRGGLPAGHRVRARPGGAGRAVLDQPVAAPGDGRAGRPRAEEEPERALPERGGDAGRDARGSTPVAAAGRTGDRRRRARRRTAARASARAVFPPVDQSHTGAAERADAVPAAAVPAAARPVRPADTDPLPLRRRTATRRRTRRTGPRLRCSISTGHRRRTTSARGRWVAAVPAAGVAASGTCP